VEKRMTTRLRLDSAQRTKVHAALVNVEEDLKSLRAEFQPRFLSIMNRAQSDIAATLTPEQRQRFEKFKEENRHLWQPR
jgi:Spy/CpxP family protein refolding chaperone